MVLRKDHQPVSLGTFETEEVNPMVNLFFYL